MITVNGTSCATPISASTFALLNDELIAAGKSLLGFLNPFLYANSAALNDITSGASFLSGICFDSLFSVRCAGANPGCSTNGFSAAVGWDPVTGLGSPNYAKLKAAAGL